MSNKFILKVIAIILIGMLLTLVSEAKSAHKITKGSPSPIDGVVLTNDLFVELHRANMKVPVLEQLRMDEKRLSKVYEEDSKKVKKELNKAKSEAFWYKVGLGMVSGFLMYRGITK